MNRFVLIETYIKVVESGSFAAAARALGLSNPAVSKQVSKLEENLGLQLLKRTTRRLELTEAGRCYYQQCKKVLEELLEADAIVSQMKEEPQGTLKVAAGRHIAEWAIVPMLHKFLEAFPKIALTLELTERIPDFNREALDLYFGSNLIPSGDVVAKKLFEAHYCLVASPEYLAECGVPEKPADLVHHRYLAHSGRRPDNEIGLKGKHVTVNPYLRVNDAKTLYTLALNGAGIALLHDYVVEKSVSEGLLEEVLKKYARPPFAVSLFYLYRRYIPPTYRAFIDFFSSNLKK